MDAAILAFEMPGMDVQIHQHAGFQIIYAFETPFNTEVEGTTYTGICGFVIKPQLPHACSGVNGKFAIINIEPDSIAGRILNKALGQSAVRVFYKDEDICTLLQVSAKGQPAVYAALAYLRSAQNTGKLSTRVQQVIDTIRNKMDQRTTPALLAASVHLSQSRLSALFKEETGSSLSKFILWTRLRRAIFLLLTEDKNLSEIAAETGFYDSPNFTKYMHQMIGVPPIAFRKKSDLIQVL